MENKAPDATSVITRKEWNERHNLEVRNDSRSDENKKEEILFDIKDVGEYDKYIDKDNQKDRREKETGENKDCLRVSYASSLCNARDIDDRECLRNVCASSLSTLTGLSVCSRVVRPCQIVRNSSTYRGTTSRRTNPSLLLDHGYDWISAEDQKILSIMVQRREAHLEEEDILVSARNLWETDRIKYNQMLNEKRRQWMELVNEKRKAEKIEQERRKENAEQMYERHIAQLKMEINERHQRCEERHNQILVQKKWPRGEMDADALCHQMRRQQLDMDSQARSELHIGAVQAKQQRVQQNRHDIQLYRDRVFKERRLKREKRMRNASQLRAAMDERFEEWCEENKQLLSSRLGLCELRAQRTVEWRRKTAQEHNYMKRLQHAHTLALLQEEDRSKEIVSRQQLMSKELRIRSSLDRKEQAKLRSRMKALTTATLRQKIKSSYNLVV